MSNKSQYKTLREWRLAKPNDYLIACRLGVLKEISEHFGWEFLEKKYDCTIEELLPSTVGCKSYSEWRKKERTFYRLACRHKLTDELCDKVGWAKRRENGYWTLERCIESAKNYKTVVEWAKKCSGSRSSAQDNGWMAECTEHMVYNNKPDGYWTRDRCIEEAKKYTTRKEWRATSKGSWGAAMTLKCYKECTSHMKPIKTKPSGYWTKEICVEEAKLYNTKVDWKKNSNGSYQASRRNGWYKDLSSHMIPLKK